MPSAITNGRLGDQATLNRYPLPGSVSNSKEDCKTKNVLDTSRLSADIHVYYCIFH